MKSTEYSFTVRWGDTDGAGIVFYPNFYKWMDEATHDFLDQIGYPSSKLFYEKQVGVPVLDTKCEFKSPLLFEDNVTIVSTVSDLHDKVFKLNHDFYKNGVRVAGGYTLRAWTYFGGERPKAVSIPEEVRTALS